MTSFLLELSALRPENWMFVLGKNKLDVESWRLSLLSRLRFVSSVGGQTSALSCPHAAHKRLSWSRRKFIENRGARHRTLAEHSQQQSGAGCLQRSSTSDIAQCSSVNGTSQIECKRPCVDSGCVGSASPERENSQVPPAVRPHSSWQRPHLDDP